VFEEIPADQVPPGRQLLGCKWVYKRKRNEDGVIVKYRARVVALGFRQKAYGSYVPEETYSPVVAKDTLRLFLSTAAKQNMPIFQADVKAAFLQAHLNEVIYMRAPEGYRQQNAQGNEVVYKLKKAIYGLKQASACFWNAIRTHLSGQGFKSVTGDPCLMRKDLPNGEQILVCLYVDDVTYAVTSEAVGNAFLEDLKKAFVIGEGEGGPIKWLLGIAIKQDLTAGTVTMCMSSVIHQLANLLLTEEERTRSSSVLMPIQQEPLKILSQREVVASDFD
jgi:hypothetical protein